MLIKRKLVIKHTIREAERFLNQNPTAKIVGLLPEVILIEYQNSLDERTRNAT